MKQVRLNRAEIWIADHALPIFAAVALAIIAGAIAIFVVFLQAGEAKDQVNVLKPQVTRVNKAICDRQSLTHPARAQRCAARIRVGLINCRHVDRCRAALLAAITYPPPARATSAPEGGGAQNPSHAGQQPAPGSPGDGGKGGSHGGGGGKGHAPPEGKPPAPEEGSPPPSTAEPGPGPQAGDQGNGQGPPPAAGKGAVEIETCIVVVCAEVGVGNR